MHTTAQKAAKTTIFTAKPTLSAGNDIKSKRTGESPKSFAIEATVSAEITQGRSPA